MITSMQEAIKLSALDMVACADKFLYLFVQRNLTVLELTFFYVFCKIVERFFSNNMNVYVSLRSCKYHKA